MLCSLQKEADMNVLCEVPLCSLQHDYLVQGIRLCFLHKISHEQKGRNPVTFFKWKRIRP